MWLEFNASCAKGLQLLRILENYNIQSESLIYFNSPYKQIQLVVSLPLLV